MKKFIKQNFKMAVGIVAILIVAVSFFVLLMRPASLEESDLRNWQTTTQARRAAAVEILTGSRENTELMVECIDAIATLPESGRMNIRDAAALCAAGIALRDMENRD
ncbi:MAG: hypothetical protein FWC83_01485 [Alphaproteobacteria bacterium]|nr:hypothetical protein [Alphaproteobacteria bacterium]